MITNNTSNMRTYSSNLEFTSQSLHLGIILAIVGGFLDAYTFTCRGGVFANAETGNIVLTGLALTQHNYIKAFSAFLPILAFILGALLSLYIDHHSITISKLYSKQAILLLEAIVLFVIGFIPTTVHNILVTTTISFVSSVQISSFRKLVGAPYSTTMCTGNLRSSCESFYIYIAKKDHVSGKKCIRYITIILFFTLGAILGGLSTEYADYKSIWLCSLFLILAIIVFPIDAYRLNRKS